MNRIPAIDSFLSFTALGASSERGQCIYITQKGYRCTWSCQHGDQRRAVLLRSTILETPDKVDVDLLTEYVLCNCCRSGRAQHRDRLEDVGLLDPLVERWKLEIQTMFVEVPVKLASHSSEDEQEGLSNDYSAVNKQDHIDEPIVATEPNDEGMRELPIPADIPGRYHLRSHGDVTVVQTPRSEFRKHIAEPTAHDTVYHQIMQDLVDRDFESGRIYVFSRISSPGHYKIGWTSLSVDDRLADWLTCGYTPILLLSSERIPNAQRIETLIHYELYKEWRRERMCAAPHCRKSHQEWFEVSMEQVTEVVNAWTGLASRYTFYYFDGQLTDGWYKLIVRMHKDRVPITATNLRRHRAAADSEKWAAQRKAICGYRHDGLRYVQPERSCVILPPHQLAQIKAEPIATATQVVKAAAVNKSTSFLTKEVKQEAVHHETVSEVVTVKAEPKAELSPAEIPLPPSPALEPLDIDARHEYNRTHGKPSFDHGEWLSAGVALP